MVKIVLVLFILSLHGCNDGSKDNEGTITGGICVRNQLAFDPIIFQQGGFHFYVIGDTGTGDENQQVSARLLENYHLQYPLDGIIHTGDIFYPNGLANAQDDTAYSKFNSIYQPLALTSIPWFFVAGNHDHDGSIDALIAFTTASESLYFPNKYYVKNLSKATLNWKMNLLATDTTPFTLGLLQAKQLAWLQNQLASLEQQRNLVIGHHPIFSNGAHGDTEELKANFYQLLKHYRVPLYLSGHDHNLQLLPGSDLSHFLVSGAGGAALTSVSCGDNLYASSSFGGFGLYITLTTIYLIPNTPQGHDIMFALPLETITDN